MDEFRIVQLAELRSKLASIPGKLIVTVLLTFGLMWKFSFETFMENPLGNGFIFVVMYGLVSYFWLCVRMTRNWLIGIVAGVILFLVVSVYLSKANGVLGTIVTCAICFGGPVLDVINIIRYFVIRKMVFRVSGSFDDGEEQDGWQQERDRDDGYARQEQDRDDGYGRQESRQQETVSAFFSGCKDEASIRRRYKDLCKVYHPDNGNGSAEIFNRITEEYNRLTGSGNNTEQ